MQGVLFFFTYVPIGYAEWGSTDLSMYTVDII
jgi:hypothetical protein